MNNADIEYFQTNWVAFQKYIIQQNLAAGLPHEFRCVDWGTMRLALMAAGRARKMDRYSDWYKQLKKRVKLKDKFSLQELRSVLP